jgi:hypothetical protein
MALRVFTDAQGHAWRIWDTRPTTGTFHGGYQTGWLTLDRDGALRRLMPIPNGWTALSDAELCALWSRAEPGQSRRSTGSAPIIGQRSSDSTGIDERGLSGGLDGGVRRENTRLQVLRAEFRARLRAVCLAMPEDEFEAMVRKAAEATYRWETRTAQSGSKRA